MGYFFVTKELLKDSPSSKLECSLFLRTFLSLFLLPILIEFAKAYSSEAEALRDLDLLINKPRSRLDELIVGLN